MLFIYGLKMLSKEDTAARGNLISSTGMFLAVLVTIVEIINPLLVISAIVLGGLIGSIFALKVKMTSIPEMVALFNGFGGLSSFFLAWSEFNNLTTTSLMMLITYTTVIIGGVTFSGSVIAFLKLSEMFKGGNNFLNKASRWFLIFSLIFIAIAGLQVVASSLGIFSFNFEIIPVSYTHLTLPTT